MLVLDRTGDGYRDDLDPRIRYVLPTGLAPLQDADGRSQIAVSRSQDGGLFSIRLRPLWPGLDDTHRPVPFVSGRFRLHLDSPAARETGQWWPTPVVGDTVVDRSVSLSPVEAAIARHLGARSESLVDVEVELRAEGLSPAFPWLVSVGTETLRARLAALLPPTPAPWEAIEAAFLGLAADTFTWYPLTPGAIHPPLDRALRAIAHHAVGSMLTADANGWSLTEPSVKRLDLNLQAPVTEREAIGLRWSFSDWIAAESDASRYVVDLDSRGPFAASVISLVNDLPLDAAGLRSIAVEVRTGGPSGTLLHEFLPGASSAARLTFVTDTLDTARVEWRARYTIITATGPIVDTTEFKAAGAAIGLDGESLGLAVLRIHADPAVFSHVRALEIQVGSRTHVLTSTSVVSWAVGRRPPPTATVAAILPDGARQPLGLFPMTSRGIFIDLATLGVGKRVPVTITRAQTLVDAAAYVAVQVEGGPWRTLDRGTAINLSMRQDASWEPPRITYRTRRVPRDTNGATGPLAESNWRSVTGTTVTVDV